MKTQVQVRDLEMILMERRLNALVEDCRSKGLIPAKEPTKATIRVLDDLGYDDPRKRTPDQQRRVDALRDGMPVTYHARSNDVTRLRRSRPGMGVVFGAKITEYPNGDLEVDLSDVGPMYLIRDEA